MFYDNFLHLCNQKGISPSAAAVEMGFQKSVVTRWKKSTPTEANRRKIAQYFGVSLKGLNVSLERLNGEVDSAQNCDQDLTIDEKQLLDNYRSLNELGQELVRQQMELIVMKPFFV